MEKELCLCEFEIVEPSIYVKSRIDFIPIEKLLKQQQTPATDFMHMNMMWIVMLLHIIIEYATLIIFTGNFRQIHIKLKGFTVRLKGHKD